MTKDEIIKLAKEAGLVYWEATAYANELSRFASLVAQQQREEDAKLVESMTLEWPDQPEFAQVERTTIQDCAKIIRQRVVTYD
jgi:hypothetical protein